MVSLLHFDTRYKHAGHYLGSTCDLEARLALHAAGRGARLLHVVQAAGITWRLARIWPGGKAKERQLKKQLGASRYCPICKEEARRTRRH
jgi:predicted GIY-YIG superfamily endonuclease